MIFLRKKKKPKLTNAIGEFVNKDLEKEYFDQEIRKAIKLLQPIILIFGMLYLLFIIPDYFLIEDQRKFLLIFTNRMVFSLLMVLLCLRMNKIKDYRTLIVFINIGEILAAVLFLIVFYYYDTPDFLIQAFGAMVIIMAIFMIPNRWINRVLNSLLIGSGFFLMALKCVNGISFSEASAVIVYMVIVIILSSYSSYQWSIIKRKQYLTEKELFKLTITDALTGIYNKKKFNDELDKWIHYAKRYPTQVSLMILDLDNFKTINDNFGHLIGDKIILDMVNLIKSIIRQTDVFARWGGEEFTILLPHTKLDEAKDLAERLREAIEGYTFKNVGDVTCSFGVVDLQSNDDAYSFFNRADTLLYQAKKDGKNMVKC